MFVCICNAITEKEINDMLLMIENEDTKQHVVLPALESNLDCICKIRNISLSDDEKTKLLHLMNKDALDFEFSCGNCLETFLLMINRK